MLVLPGGYCGGSGWLRGGLGKAISLGRNRTWATREGEKS